MTQLGAVKSQRKLKAVNGDRAALAGEASQAIRSYIGSCASFPAGVPEAHMERQGGVVTSQVALLG